MHAPKNLDIPSKETTPFNQIFGGYLRQDVTCLRCKNVSITFQHFMDVLLDIRQASNVEDALAIFFRPERIGGSGDSGEQTQNMYKCEKCKAKGRRIIPKPTHHSAGSLGWRCSRCGKKTYLRDALPDTDLDFWLPKLCFRKQFGNPTNRLLGLTHRLFIFKNLSGNPWN